MGRELKDKAYKQMDWLMLVNPGWRLELLAYIEALEAERDELRKKNAELNDELDTIARQIGRED